MPCRRGSEASPLAMELSEFLLLFTTTHMFLGSDGAAHAAPDPMHIDSALAGLLSDAPWAPVFFIICTAVLATMTSPSPPSASASVTSSSPSPRHLEWSIPRHSALWLRLNKPVGVLNPMMHEQQWLHHCRMSYPAFVYLVEELRPHLVRAADAQAVREPVEVELAVAMVLNRLASGASPAVVGGLCGVEVSVVVDYTRLVTSILASYDMLYSKYIVAPTGERLERIIKGFFEETGVPNMAGAIGGTQIVLKSKPNRAAEFHSGEGEGPFYSVLLQGVCDVDKVFWDVCCVATGGSNDEEHLKSSRLWSRLCENEILREPVITVQGKPIRPFLVGNKNYPLLPFLMKPFHAGQAGVGAEFMFDAKLQKGHASIATSFGILKNRWKILKNLNVDLKSASETVAACCVLHNFCQLSNQPEPNIRVDDALNRNISDRREDFVGEETRRVLFLDWFARHHNLH